MFCNVVLQLGAPLHKPQVSCMYAVLVLVYRTFSACCCMFNPYVHGAGSDGLMRLILTVPINRWNCGALIHGSAVPANQV